MTQAIEKAAGGVWRTPGAAVQERAGATFLFCDPMVAQNSGKRKTQFSEHAPSDTRDLDTLLATVRGAFFDARAVGDLAQAAELAGTYRHSRYAAGTGVNIELESESQTDEHKEKKSEN